MNEKLVLTVEFDQVSGQINVNGPINNKTLCYGMLEAAKDAIRDFVAKNTEHSSIMPVTILPFNGRQK